MSLTTASTKIDVSAATMAELVAFHNSVVINKPVKKFADRATAVKRCLLLLVEPNPEPEVKKAPARQAPKAADPFTKAAADLAAGKIALTEPRRRKAAEPTTPKAPKAPKAPRSATAGAKGRALFSEDGIITVVHKGENPKKSTAADRFALYRSGMTVAAYIAAGGQRRDVVWDQHQGWISVKG